MSDSGSQTAKFLLHQLALKHSHPLPVYDTVSHHNNNNYNNNNNNNTHSTVRVCEGVTCH